jgi:BirA family biotin operon repressor/biotin-[acetyl-CoA-carboxylase] ligase
VELKWPNDLLLRGRKVAGVLTEMQGEQDRVRHVVLGIGVDVNLEESDLPAALKGTATSLRMVAGRRFDRAELATLILRELDEAYGELRAGGFERLADAWEEACATVGRRVRVELGGRVIRGVAEALDAEGMLLVRTEHGMLEGVTGGDVKLDD